MHCFSCVCRFPVVAMGLLKWVDCTVCDPSFFKLLTDSTPVHLALLDEVCHSKGAACHLTPLPLLCDSSWPPYTKASPGVSGNKGTWPLTFWEHGNKGKIKLGTREQKHVLGNREHQNRRNTFREHGNTRKILLGTWTSPGGPLQSLS